jgi:Cu-Zn family superoxide dismutase
MRKLRARRLLAALAVTVAAAAFLPSAAARAQTPSDAADANTAAAVVRDVNNNFLGVVVIQATRDGKLVVAGRLTGLAEGFHGFHIHTTGICDPRATDPTGAVVPFASAGGHLNPAGATHGHHAGDLPSLLVARDGTASAVTPTDAVTLANIFDADGSALIVHAAPDNFANIPTRYTSSTTGLPGPDAATLATGDSGARFACGVIVRG